MLHDNQLQPIVALSIAKQTIIKTFHDNVKGRKSDTALANLKHSGKEGHWLETAMGIIHNGNNAPDILGYEMKNATSLKTTFGDWSANYYIFNDPNYSIDRTAFMQIFGKPNAKKNGRYSWSGEPCPKISSYNRFGQKLVVDEQKNILAVYSYSQDRRNDKSIIVPEELQIENLLLARWDATKLMRRVEDKFNDMGWFKCEKDNYGTYTTIAFGDPITFDVWIDCVKKGEIFFDSGMYEGNRRPYSQWRASNDFWDKRVTSRYS